jgi:hypothetical protein
MDARRINCDKGIQFLNTFYMNFKFQPLFAAFSIVNILYSAQCGLYRVLCNIKLTFYLVANMVNLLAPEFYV